jgi:short subunit fatty acids transporter
MKESGKQQRSIKEDRKSGIIIMFVLILFVCLVLVIMLMPKDNAIKDLEREINESRPHTGELDF